MKTKYSDIIIILFICFFFISNKLNAQTECPETEDGYRMWLKYEKISDDQLLKNYRQKISAVVIKESSATMKIVKAELCQALESMLDCRMPVKQVAGNNHLVVGTPESSTVVKSLSGRKLSNLGDEGFLIESTIVNGDKLIIIAANTDIGVLYGTFHFLRMLQTGKSVADISLRSVPKSKLRISNHWDDIDRRVGRGYAGLSLWEWTSLPEYKHPRYTDFARISASIGINGVAINNVNADPWFITDFFLERIAVLADIFRPYGIKVYISVNFNSPVVLGGLKTSDPLDKNVIDWWQKKTKDIYSYIPDLGGFLIKADSEGQPGPKTYDRNHAEGANMFADVLDPFGGIVIWRAFVYGEKQKDRIREAYDEFVPLDGKFNDNVVLQIKNGPLDFMPREPFSPLFGAMPRTNTIIEFQVTQEYLGNGNHLVYKGSMFKETLDADTYAKGTGSTVAKILTGEVFDYKYNGMAAVINPGTDRNWTGHPFVQSSWYAFGRLAWDYHLSAEELADEWIRQTFSNNQKVVDIIKKIMIISGEASVNFREPLGLTHIGTRSHYGPAPWYERSVSFHHADQEGIGFDRTVSGSNAAAQYNEPLKSEFSDINLISEKYLLWFHHVKWNHIMKSGRNLWEELVYKYYDGAETVKQMQNEWNLLEGLIDKSRFYHVKSLLEIQKKDAVRWRNSCVLYFQTFSKQPIPEGLTKPEHDMDYYKQREREIYVR